MKEITCKNRVKNLEVIFMTRLTKEYLKSLTVMYHAGRCSCGSQWCNGHIGRIINNEFVELANDEIIFVKLKLGLGIPTYYTGEIEGIKSPSELFKFVRKYEYNNIDQLLIKLGCKAVCCYNYYPYPYSKKD